MMPIKAFMPKRIERSRYRASMPQQSKRWASLTERTSATQEKGKRRADVLEDEGGDGEFGPVARGCLERASYTGRRPRRAPKARKRPPPTARLNQRELSTLDQSSDVLLVVHTPSLHASSGGGGLDSAIVLRVFS
jgi:hypothetical protein